jgi:N-methylhydantoinase A
MDPVRAALGIVDIVDARMADLLRTMTISTGYDPREFVLFAYGGAGPVHVGAYARQLGVSKVYVPLYAPVQSAFGIATGEFRRHQTRAAPMREPYVAEAIRETCAAMEASMQADWEATGLDADAALYQRFVDMRFRHQVHEIRVPLSPEDTAGTLVQRFFTSYEQAFGRGSAVAGSPTEIVTFHLVSTLPAAAHSLTRPLVEGPAPAPTTTRNVYFDEQPIAAPVFALADLRPGARLEGPLIVESSNTTIVVHAGQTVEVDGYSNLGITV